MQGIYIIKNTINNKVYIGQSTDIDRRWYAHLSLGKKEANPERLEYNNQIHTAMRKYGRERFYIEVLEECERDELDEREIYWIAFYNSYRDGYNGTEGGSFEKGDKSEEHNGRALLKKEDVIHIRELYNSHVPFREVYKLYQNKITKRGLQNVWYFKTWKKVLPEYNTIENKEWHKTASKANPPEVAANNKRSFSPEQVIEMREKYMSGISIQQIWKELYSEKAKTTIYNAIHGKTYKDIY